jgi:DNA-binding transcriptional regulator YhcF (GntR family)
MAIVIKTLSEQIYDYIFREIRIGNLKYGEKIDENELIDKLGVSRTPIREALIQLSSDNILDNLSRKGFYVRHISAKEMDDAFAVIARLDTYAIELFMDRVDEETLAHLEACVASIDKAIARHDYEEYYNWQEAFHLTYIGKTTSHHAPRCVPFEEHRELIDEILKTVAQKGKGLEMNTSGVDRCGGFLPTEDYFRRFKEFGGEIVTIGSDAHTASRVGQYSFEACAILKDIFGYVCTFQDRKPIFHKL